MVPLRKRLGLSLFTRSRAKSYLHRIISNDPHFCELSCQELDALSKFPIFREANKETRNKGITKKRQSYLDEKLPNVRLRFGDDVRYPNAISHVLPSHSSPLEAIQSTNQKVPARLSVTKMLTKSWCELRHAYDVYAEVPIFEGRAITEGKEEHQKLEDTTHTLAEEQRNFENDFEVEIPHDKFHNIAGAWFETLIKMVNLFTDGEAREVLCHGYLNSQSCHLVEGPVTGDEDILISGVIDHLLLSSKNSDKMSRVEPVRLEDSVVSKECKDISLILHQLENAEFDLSNNFEIIVSDVKTRFTSQIPSQATVLRASKLQVMYYRHFLEFLGKTPSLTYEKLLTNAQRRGLDVNRLIDPGKVLSMLAADDLIRSDMYRLKNGESIGFEPFDNDYLTDSASAIYDMSDYHNLIVDARIIEKYGDFFEPWQKPVTLKYFASRLAQMYHKIAPLLSDKLMIEYYCNGDNFHNILFEYDIEILRSNCFNSAQFWLGKREIEPIKPNIKNFLTYCKYCDYESVCSWKKAGNDMCRRLGSDLANISKN
ncbi:probable Exonuclease V, mitochondrial [Zygosaccharomyces bailii]|nr:probable Exonuclease V, mitochondrial [Zygosaccharomyces bailii]